MEEEIDKIKASYPFISAFGTDRDNFLSGELTVPSAQACLLGFIARWGTTDGPLFRLSNNQPPNKVSFRSPSQARFAGIGFIRASFRRTQLQNRSGDSSGKILDRGLSDPNPRPVEQCSISNVHLHSKRRLSSVLKGHSAIN